MKSKSIVPTSIKVHLKNLGYHVQLNWLKKPSDIDMLNVLKVRYFLEISLNEILKKKMRQIPINSRGIPFVYVLILNDQPVYVGETMNLINRIAQHEKNFGDKFDSIYFQELNNSNDLLKEELKFICRFYPKLNSEISKNEILPKFMQKQFYNSEFL